jgi:hypothetical protein
METPIYLIYVEGYGVNEIWGHVKTLDDAKYFLNFTTNCLVNAVKERKKWAKLTIENPTEQSKKIYQVTEGYVYNSSKLLFTIRYEPIYFMHKDNITELSTHKPPNPPPLPNFKYPKNE